RRTSLFILPLYLLRIISGTCYFAAKQWYNGRGLFINCFSQMKHNQYTGVPIGGIGCGSIGTDFRGAFNKFSLSPGIKEHLFSLYIRLTERNLFTKRLLSAADFDDSTLSDWCSHVNGEDIRYQRGLFPRAWREFRIADLDLTLICEQISPIIPHNYEDSSFPVCNFYWTIINESKNDYSISLTFTFRNGTGNPKWDNESECEANELTTKSAAGMTLSHSINSMPVNYAIASEKAGDTKISYSTFNPCSLSGSEIWETLSSTGSLSGGFYITNHLFI
ncbi:hypothetical protein OSTOST_17671, partial [Ostertagia ostertagi]